MLATFLLAEPATVAVALAVLVATTALLRVVRLAKPSRTSLVIVSGAALAAGGVGATLAITRTPLAHVLLLILSAIAAVALSSEAYHRQRTRLGASSAAFCTLVRIFAWVALLITLGRLRWDWVVVEWEKPLLVALLDESMSMSIIDRGGPPGNSRAVLVRQAVAGARSELSRLGELYRVQLFGIGADLEPLDDWRIQPQAPVSPLAAALRHAGQSRSLQGEPPVAVLLISDGAENAAGTRVVRAAADELAAQRTALVAIGVGPSAELNPAVVLDPLVVPGQIGSRDRVRVPVTAQITGCARHAVNVAMLWGDEQADERQLRIERAAQRVDIEFELQPPGVGLHRLTARVSLPDDLGGDSSETSVVVDVRDDRIRVLLLEGQPHNELTFAARALGGDPRFEIVQRRLLTPVAQKPEADSSIAPPSWADYDVVIFGDVPAKLLGFGTLSDLAHAVQNRGVGLLMVGGRDFYHQGYYSRSELADVSPADFTLSRPADDYRPRFRPTETGRRHPVLAGIGGSSTSDGDGEQAAQIWSRLPALGGAARLGKLKPLAEVLATDDSGHPLLATLDVGRGRVVAAAWNSSWDWALSSDEGLAVHGKLWRQMAIWLANRQPVAWVVTDRSSYVRAALAGGQQSLQIRAGLSGIEPESDPSQRVQFEARLQLRLVQPGRPRTADNEPAQPQAMPATQPASLPAQTTWDIPLKRRANEWRAVLPRDLQTLAWLESGTYELLFVVEQIATGPNATTAPAESGDHRRLTLTAQTGFDVTAVDLELLEPTSNLVLLREAAARTEAVRGAYYGIEAFSDAIRHLEADDRRQRIERRQTFDLTQRQPWLLMLLITTALATEWIVRKRGGAA